MNFILLKVSIKASLLCLKRCNPLLAPRFKVLSALIEIVLPFLKSASSSVVRGTIRTPVFIIDDTSSLFSASFINDHPIDVVPKSNPNIFFIYIFLDDFT
ncbi:hypothetical protein D3C86_1213990 [compost metagenome]